MSMIEDGESTKQITLWSMLTFAEQEEYTELQSNSGAEDAEKVTASFARTAAERLSYVNEHKGEKPHSELLGIARKTIK